MMNWLSVKFTIPLSLSALVWSGYVMFDMFEYYINDDEVFFIKPFMGFIGVIVFSITTYLGFHEELLEGEE